MALTSQDVINSRAAVDFLAAKDKNDKIDYLGERLFPNVYTETSEVEVLSKDKVRVTALKLSALDAKPTLRARENFNLEKVEAPFFREKMQVTEKDEQKLKNIESTKSPMVRDIVKGIFDDVTKLKRAADISPEIMRFQLMFPQTGGPKINIAGVDNMAFIFDFDPNGTWAAHNRTDLSGVNQWCNAETADPVQDINNIKESDDVDADLKYLIMNKQTLKMAGRCKKIKDLIIQKKTDNTISYITDSMVIDVFKEYCDLDGIVIYDKKVFDEAGNKVKLIPDGFIGLSETLNLGRTWRIPTPEERTKGRKQDADVTIISSTRVAVTIFTTQGIPTVSEIYVSESCLPTFNDMADYYMMFVGTPEDNGKNIKLLTATAAEGTVSGTTKFTVGNMVDSVNNTLRVKVFGDGEEINIPNYNDYLGNWAGSKAYVSGDDLEATGGSTCVIAEVDSHNRCVGFVTVIAVTKA